MAATSSSGDHSASRVDLAHRLEGAHGVDVAAEDDEDLPGDVGRGRGGQERHDVGDVLGVPGVEAALAGAHAVAAEDGLGHPGAGTRRNGVGRDAVAAELAGLHPGECGDAGLGRGVVRLSGAAEQAGLRGGVDDAAGDVLARLGPVAPVHRGVVGGGEVALEMDPDHVVPVRLVDVEGHLVAEDPGVVDQDVERAEGVDRLLHDVLAAGPRADVVAVDGGVAAPLLDQRHDLLGGVRVQRALAVQPRADVVDDDPGALTGEHQCLFASDASSRAGDDRHLAVEQSHGDASLCRSTRQSGRPGGEGPAGGADGRRGAPAVWPMGSFRGKTGAAPRR